MTAALSLISASCLTATLACAQAEAVPTFGTTVVVPGGLQGAVYHIRHNSTHLPEFEKLKPVGLIYTSALNVPPHDFQAGFPGVTHRFEWFAIDFTGRFWIQTPGLYRFELTSDDGSKLYIDDRLAIDNNGAHPPQTRLAALTLEGGIHRIRVSYFQGRRYQVALTLRIARPDEDWRVFSTEEFKPPADPESWTYPQTSQSAVKIR